MNILEFPSYFYPVVLRICDFLRISDIKNLSLVSKEWFQATHTPLVQRTQINVNYCYYWKFLRKYENISIVIGDFDINLYLRDFLSWYKTSNVDKGYLIKKLSLSTYKKINSKTFHLLLELKSLKVLSIKANYLEEFDHSLELSLGLIEFGLYVSSFHQNHNFCHAEIYLKNICRNNRALKVFHCDYFTEDGIKYLLENCTAIENLNYYNKLDLYPPAINSLYESDVERNLIFFGIHDIELFNLKHLKIENIKKMSLFVTMKEGLTELFIKLSNVTHLSLTVINLEQWLLSSLALYLKNLTCLILIYGHGSEITEQIILPKLMQLEISNLTRNHLLENIYAPVVSRIRINYAVSKEEFLNFMNDDYKLLEELKIRNLHQSTETEICSVLKKRQLLKTLKIENCENFSIECLKTICDSQIKKAEITTFSDISLWRFKIFNRKWKLEETRINTNRKLTLSWNERRIVLNYISL
ncbi:hypothetical protein ACFFRR_009933 [Megaselia abdita]